MHRPSVLVPAAAAFALLFVGAPARADDAPPRIRHAPLTKASKGESITISAAITDESAIFAPTLYYRYAGGKGFTNVTMSRKGENYVATLQATADVDYWIEAWDELGNGPARDGSPERPYRIEVAVPVARAAPAPKKVAPPAPAPVPAPAPEPVAEPEPAPAAPEPVVVLDAPAPVPAPAPAAVTWDEPPLANPDPPLYQQWWFWAGTGGAAAVVTTVLVIALQPPPLYQNVVTGTQLGTLPP